MRTDLPLLVGRLLHQWCLHVLFSSLFSFVHPCVVWMNLTRITMFGGVASSVQDTLSPLDASELAKIYLDNPLQCERSHHGPDGMPQLLRLHLKQKELPSILRIQLSKVESPLLILRNIFDGYGRQREAQPATRSGSRHAPMHRIAWIAAFDVCVVAGLGNGLDP